MMTSGMGTLLSLIGLSAGVVMIMIVLWLLGSDE